MKKKKKLKKTDKPMPPPTKKTSDEQTLLGVAKETAAAPGAEALPKGNGLEAKIASEAAQADQPQEPQEKRKRGRPRGSKSKVSPDEETPVNDTDIITPAINGMIIPLFSKRLRRDAKDLMFTPEEQAMLKHLQPPNDWNKPSWPAFIITAISTIMIHYYNSEYVKEPETEKQPEPPKVASREQTREENAETIAVAFQ